MTALFNDDWARALERELAGTHEFAVQFRDAARWFSGSVVLQSVDSVALVEVAKGDARVSLLPVASEAVDVVAMISGSREAWLELFDPSTVNGVLNRLWRQGKMAVSGDLVLAMKFWKVLFWMTEVGDLVFDELGAAAP